MGGNLIVVAVALIDVDDRVLVTKRPAGKHMGGLWEFPGGKIEIDESPEAALIRELKEELGINVSESCLAPFSFASYQYQDFHLLMPLYICRTWVGVAQSKEGQELKWIKPIKLMGISMAPANVQLIAMLRDFL